LFYKWTGKKWAPNPGGKRGPKRKPKIRISERQISMIHDLVYEGKFATPQDAFDAVLTWGFAHLYLD
jgi:hypothetical protein